MQGRGFAGDSTAFKQRRPIGKPCGQRSGNGFPSAMDAANNHMFGGHANCAILCRLRGNPCPTCGDDIALKLRGKTCAHVAARSILPHRTKQKARPRFRRSKGLDYPPCRQVSGSSRCQPWFHRVWAGGGGVNHDVMVQAARAKHDSGTGHSFRSQPTQKCYCDQSIAGKVYLRNGIRRGPIQSCHRLYCITRITSGRIAVSAATTAARVPENRVDGTGTDMECRSPVGSRNAKPTALMPGV